MQSDGRAAELPPERTCDHVLAGMLLHMIKAARPVYPAVNRIAGGERRVNDMPDFAGIIDENVAYARVVQQAGIKRLAAGGGIKRGAIE